MSKKEWSREVCIDLIVEIKHDLKRLEQGQRYSYLVWLGEKCKELDLCKELDRDDCVTLPFFERGEFSRIPPKTPYIAKILHNLERYLEDNCGQVNPLNTYVRLCDEEMKELNQELEEWQVRLDKFTEQEPLTQEELRYLGRPYRTFQSFARLAEDNRINREGRREMKEGCALQERRRIGRAGLYLRKRKEGC